MKSKHTFRLSPEVAKQLTELAIRKRVSQAEIVETALTSFLSPDGSERMEAAFSRRLDRIARQFDQLEKSVEVGNEALALFVRFWLTANPALPDGTSVAATAQGKARYAAFVEALARRIQSAQGLWSEINSGAP